MLNTKPRVKLLKYQTKYLPTELVKLAKEQATSDFCATTHAGQIEQHLPFLPSGYEYSINSGVLLKVKNVEPHRDFDVGFDCKWTGGCFGVLSTTKQTYIQVGNEHLELQKGDWILFDDDILHSLQSAVTIYGLAVQVGTK